MKSVKELSIESKIIKRLQNSPVCLKLVNYLFEDAETGRVKTDAGISERLHYQPRLQLEKLSSRKADGADREQRGADHGSKAGRSQLLVLKSRGAGAEP